MATAGKSYVVVDADEGTDPGGKAAIFPGTLQGFAHPLDAARYRNAAGSPKVLVIVRGRSSAGTSTARKCGRRPRRISAEDAREEHIRVTNSKHFGSRQTPVGSARRSGATASSQPLVPALSRTCGSAITGSASSPEASQQTMSMLSHPSAPGEDSVPVVGNTNCAAPAAFFTLYIRPDWPFPCQR